MNADMEEQEDELLAVQSIFDSEEFVRDESRPAGEIRVSVELPADFTVTLIEGESLRQYEMSFLPPLLLTFELPEDYPSSSPPSFTLTCSWLTHTQLSALGAQLAALYLATGGAVVLFSWVQFLKEDALRFLDIHTVLELPSDERTTRHDGQNSLNVAPSAPTIDHPTPTSGPADSQRCNVLDPRKPDLSAPPSEAEHSIAILADGQDPSTSGWSNTDSRGTAALIQNTSNDSNQSAQTSDLPFAPYHQEDFLNQGDVSASPILPPSPSDTPDPSEQGAASLPSHSSKHPQNEGRRFSALSLKPSQTLLSQLLIYNAAQKQKVFATTVFDCGVCFVGWLGSDCVQLPECGHIFCQTCLAMFCKLQITEGKVKGVTCPEADCSATPTPAQVKLLVGEELFGRYDRLLLQSTLDCMADVVYCPRLRCGSAVIVEKSGTAALCSVCRFAFCVSCRKTYHGTVDCRVERITNIQEAQGGNRDLPQSQEGLMALWDDYASGSKQRRGLLESRYGRNILQGILEECLSKDWMACNSKNCPHCFWHIQKNGGCNMMTCSQCRQMFCWVCLTRLSALNFGTHFKDGGCTPYQYQRF